MRKVPLIIKVDGKKKQIGEAVIHDSGAVDGMITDEVSLDAVLGADMVFGAALGPLPVTNYKE